MSVFPTGRIMQKRRTEYAASFKVWTTHGTWFWSLFYPDQHGGAIGAAPSQAEAMREAQAALECVPQLPHYESGKVGGCEVSTFARRFNGSIDLRISTAPELDHASGGCECSEGSGNRSSRMRAVAARYNELWRMTLQQYAARIAGA